MAECNGTRTPGEGDEAVGESSVTETPVDEIVQLDCERRHRRKASEKTGDDHVPAQ